MNWLRPLFACSHRKISRAFWDDKLKRNYVVCMGCCGKFAYDWSAMKTGERIDGPTERRDSTAQIPEPIGSQTAT